MNPLTIKNIFLISALCTIHSIKCLNEPALIYIHEVRTIMNDADCYPSQWNKRENSCECCLLYSSHKNNKKNAEQIIQDCTKEEYCTSDLISSIKKQRNIKSTASNQDFLNTLTQEGLVIKRMNVDPSFFGPNGALTETSLPKFLAQAFKEKKLNNDDFSKQDCLKAKNLGTQGGYNTLQLFLITSTCHAKAASMYIVKEAKSGLDEATKLTSVAHFPGIKDLIAPKVTSGLPSIALPIAYFSYPQSDKIHYLATMPAAKGKDLATLIHTFRSNQSPQNRELLNRAFKILGKEIAAFHKRFMAPQKGKILGNTIVHGDFHTFNLFFDEIGGHFTFIDNETIANYLEKRASPVIDLVKLFFMPFNINAEFKQFRELIEGISLETWFDIALKNFLIGYKDIYSANEQKKVLQELKKMFNEKIEIPWIEFNDQQLQELRDKYINPIFNALIGK